MSQEFRLKLPLPPSVNRIWRAMGNRIILSSEARAYYEKARNYLPTGPVTPLRGRLQVKLVFHPTPALAASAWDIANREKILCDLLTRQRVWVDDSQIDMLLIVRGLPRPKGFVDIQITET